MHAYEIRSRSDKRGADLISDVLPFGRVVWPTKRNQQGIGNRRINRGIGGQSSLLTQVDGLD
jgi:hypothetical protein